MALQPSQRKKTMIDALCEHMGNVSEAVKVVGISRRTHYDWMRDDADYKAAVEEIDESTIDFVESKLRQLITGITMHNGENTYTVAPCKTSIIFFLKTKAKKRGYVEQVEQSVTIQTEKGYIGLPDGTKLEI